MSKHWRKMLLKILIQRYQTFKVNNVKYLISLLSEGYRVQMFNDKFVERSNSMIKRYTLGKQREWSNFHIFPVEVFSYTFMMRITLGKTWELQYYILSLLNTSTKLSTGRWLEIIIRRVTQQACRFDSVPDKMLSGIFPALYVLC